MSTIELSESQRRIKALLDDCRTSLAYAAPEVQGLFWQRLGKGFEDLLTECRVERDRLREALQEIADGFGLRDEEPGDFLCGRCGHLLDGGTDEPAHARTLRKRARAALDPRDAF